MCCVAVRQFCNDLDNVDNRKQPKEVTFDNCHCNSLHPRVIEGVLAFDIDNIQCLALRIRSLLVLHILGENCKTKNDDFSRSREP